MESLLGVHHRDFHVTNFDDLDPGRARREKEGAAAIISFLATARAGV